MVHTLGNRGRKNVLKNAPGPPRALKRVQTQFEAFSLFILGEMLNHVVEYTNNLIEQFIADHREVIENSDKYSFYKPVDLADIKAVLGLLYLRATLKLGLFDREII